MKKTILCLIWLDSENEPIDFIVEQIEENFANVLLGQHKNTLKPKYIETSEAARYGIRVEPIAPLASKNFKSEPETSDEIDTDDEISDGVNNYEAETKGKPGRKKKETN